MELIIAIVCLLVFIGLVALFVRGKHAARERDRAAAQAFRSATLPTSEEDLDFLLDGVIALAHALAARPDAAPAKAFAAKYREPDEA